MKTKRFSFTKSKLLCILTALIMLFAAIMIIPQSGYANAATESAADEGLYLPTYDTQVITKKKLKKPKVKTFGDHEASYYPSYTHPLESFDNDKKAEILAENEKIIAETNAMFADGTLKDNLKKHVSADGQFSDEGGGYKKAARIEKEITVNSKTPVRKRPLGVFAPAGEVLTITIDESLVDSKLTVNIGYPYSASDIGANKLDRWPKDRMARFYLSFTLTETVTHIGSPLGGMVTLDGVSSSLGNFKIKISGGIDMPDYKLGVSTKEDWKNILAAPAPYVWLLTPHQFFVMPKVEIRDIEDPYQALLWWHKASMISIYGVGREYTSHFTTPVISVYDSYVFVGEAVATVWAFYTNSPSYWCKGVLDYDSIMSSGAWGAIHEYNHHHQAYTYSSSEWGVGGIDEITNNVLNAASYILLTDIAATRSESNQLNGWAAVSDPYCNYKRLAGASASAANYEALDTNKLFGMVDLMHTFGADKFLGFIRAQYGLAPVEGYNGKNLTEDGYLNTQDGFTLLASLYYKTDFTDYFTKVWHFELSGETVNKIKSYGFDEYFSINNLYAAGIKGIETGRAYKINAGETVLDFNKFTNCSADGYKLDSVSAPEHGKLTHNSDGTYSYLPDDDFTDDSFELTYSVTLNGRTYSRTLVVRLTANADGESETEPNVYPAFIDFRNRYINNFYSNSVRYTPSEAKCVDSDGNDVITVNGADINAMFDGNTATGFHTAWQGKKTPYPHVYYFTFEEQAVFNRMNFIFQNNGSKGYYSFGDYEIYTSENGDDYTLLSSGKNGDTNFNVAFDDTVVTKHVKIVVNSNASGQAFTNITELEFVKAVDMGEDYNVYSSADGVFKYKKKWKNVTGSFINSTAKHAKRGKIKFYLTGTDLVLFSVNAQSKITIDGESYIIKENRADYAPSFAIDGLSEGRHLVVIEASDMNFDMIKTTGTIAVKPFPAWLAWIIVIGFSLVVLGAVALTIVIVFKRKNRR